jgi:transposase-like protein
MRRGRNHGWVLTPHQKREAMRAYRRGDLVRLIARRFGVATNSISQLAQARGLRRRKVRSDKMEPCNIS